MTYLEYANIFKALSDETRVEILEMVSKEKLCACKILERFNITQPTLSHHMKKLCEVNLVICEKDSKWSYYQINPEKIKEINEFIKKLNESKVKQGNKYECI